MKLFQRLARLLLFVSWCIPASATGPVGQPIRIAEELDNGDRFMGIELLGSLALRGDPALAELSDLAWDEDEQMLLAISDQGRVLQLRPRFSAGRLSQVELVAAHRLLDRQGAPLRGGWSDAEGLTLENSSNGVQGDTALVISFERHHRIDRYRPDGTWLASLPLPNLLEQTGFRPKNNRGLEAVTLHPQYGLVTGPEYPPKGKPHYLTDGAGRIWQYPVKEPDGALVALEALPNGDLMLLERAYTSIFSPWVISLTRIRAADLAASKAVETELIARFDSGRGWLMQNMEGLTRHRGMYFFMVSDDGDKPWAQTQLFYFKIVPE